MSRNTKTILEVVLAIAVMAIASLIVYYLGSILAKSFLNAESVKHSEWLKSYFGLVRGTGIAQFVCLVVWIALARFVLTVHDPFGAGKRAVWAVLLVAMAAGLLCQAGAGGAGPAARKPHPLREVSHRGD